MNCTVKRQNNLLTVMARGVQQSVLTVHGGQCESFLFGKTLRIFADRQAFGHRLRIIAIRLALVRLKLFEMKTESKRDHEGFEQSNGARQMPVYRQPVEYTHRCNGGIYDE